MASINTNVVSLNAQRNQAASQSSLATSMQRLSSGLRVNSAKDDAAGLAIAERMSAQVKGMNVAVRNANDAISQMQTAEGALGKVGENLQRIRELAVQSSNGSLSQNDRDNLQLEVDQLQEEVVRVVDNSKFNGVKLFDGASKSVDFQIGADNGDKITADTTGFDLKTNGNLKAYASGAKAKAIDISSQASAQTVLDDMDTDIDTVNKARSTAGALQSRFEAVIGQLQVSSENTSAARGRIMDADFASETANLSRAQILQQAGTAMIAQANQLPQQVMQLLR